MVNNAILTNSSYKMRFAQDITLYLSEIALDLRASTLRGKSTDLRIRSAGRAQIR